MSAAASDHVAFGRLQARLRDLWPTISAMNDEPQTIVSLPSMPPDIPPGTPPALIRAYEDRNLYLLFLLRQPAARLVVLATEPVPDAVIDYHLRLLPGVPPAHARARLTVIALGGDPLRPLSERLLERPDALDAVRTEVDATGRAHLVPFVTGALERQVALALDVPVYGPDPDLEAFGTKSGARRLFRQVGVPLPDGVEDVTSRDHLVEAIAAIRARVGGLAQVVLKPNTGFGGWTNASLDLRGLPAPGAVAEGRAVDDRLGSLRVPGTAADPEAYLAAYFRHGGVVEQRIVGDGFASPSAQLRVDPFGGVELLSTFDQMLAGPDHTEFVGGVFPADPAYAPQVAAHGRTVAQALAQAGVLGRFAIDFVVVRRDQAWDAYAIEINLRKGGTTHPYLSVQWLTDARYQVDAGALVAPDGRRFALITSDHIEHPGFAQMPVDRAAAALEDAGLAFRPDACRGVILNMLTALPLGRLGLTAAAADPASAQDLYGRAIEVLTAAASA